MGRHISTTKILRSLFRAAIGIILLPAACASIVSTYKLLFKTLTNINFYKPFLIGAAIYLVIAVLIRIFPYAIKNSNASYVLAHELSHAFAAILFLKKIYGIKIRKNHGSIKMSGSNFIIGLAPYFIPFYALITAAACQAMTYFFPGMIARKYFIGITGFFIAFHFRHTAEMLLGPIQPDLEEEGGRIFSFTVIIIFSCLTSALIVFLASNDWPNLKGMTAVFIADQKMFYEKGLYLLKYIYNYILNAAYKSFYAARYLMR